MGYNGASKEPLSSFESPRRPATDTAEAVFGDFWEAPLDSSFHSRGIKKNRKNHSHVVDYDSSQDIASDLSVTESQFANLDTPERSGFYEPRGAEYYLSKYPTVTSLITELQPKKWILDFNCAGSSPLQSSTEGKEKRKSSKKGSSGLTNEDVPFNKIQFIWNSELDERKRVKLNSRASKSSRHLLSDPNDNSPIIINFPHPIQLQNMCIPYEILDPRSVPCGSFVWWDRRVWEYNFIHMARRLSTNDERSCKKLNIESPVASKRHVRESEEESERSPRCSNLRIKLSTRLEQDSDSPNKM
ncbi:hypothetical protein OIY81_917 [Cryptosporidium canis]|uniref:Uncharacterized protein n=1 Tax=Cryptosporidium canis TaxID=195482 RepID=A0ABQ8PCC1_9CRYT|nr:hypothetical protein OIY81_917 [Cryptosporidium canis]KAJ1615515.1 hypothetical protein OJ252_74 [Cryptosporidium canis]